MAYSGSIGQCLTEAARRIEEEKDRVVLIWQWEGEVGWLMEWRDLVDTAMVFRAENMPRAYIAMDYKLMLTVAKWARDENRGGSN